MAQALRRIDPLVFDENIADNWRKFEKEWTIYSNAGLSDKSKKVQAYTLLNLAGLEAVEKSESFVYAEGESHEEPDILLIKFRELCLPAKNIIMDRHAFNTANQGTGESIQAYVSTLKILAKKCEFGALRDDLIRDRIVCGIQNDRLRKQLLREQKLTLELAISLCLLHEQSEKSSKELRKENDVCSIQRARCGNCNGQHSPDRGKCYALNKICNNCGKLNHFAKCCRSAPAQPTARHTAPYQHRRRATGRVNELTTEPDNQVVDTFYCDTIFTSAQKGEIFATLAMQNGNGQLRVKVDTGAKCNVLPRKMLHAVDHTVRVDPNEKVNLVAYGGETIKTDGTVTLQCTQGQFKFHVVNRDVKPILGLQDSVALGLIQLGPDVHTLQQEATERLEYQDLFDTTCIGKLPVVYHMRLDDTVAPTICAPRRIPIAMKDKVKMELDRMTALGVITPENEATEWVSAMVAAKKKDGSVRLCIDPVHLNQALLRPRHPLKSIEQIIADMPGAKIFSILDAKCGFWQIPLDHASSKLTTFMSPHGRYRFLRMPYGICTGSEVFQNVMEQLFAGQPCEIVVDDILIWGRTLQEHDERLAQVMNRIRAINMKLNPEKCKFRVNSVQYVGHLLTADGVKPDPEKVKAVCEMEKPQDKQALQQFLGMTNYLSKFIPQYSDLTGPLRQLIHHDVEWHWHDAHDAAFSKLKQALTNPPVLQFFDTSKPVVISADASQHGLGAVCLQQGRPVAFASRALTPTESRYAQIEKEMLALVFAAKKFHDFIYGRPVTAETDHQPLVTIVRKPLHTASARLQGMMLKLQRYDLDVMYKRGKELFVADALSRAHLPESDPPLTDDLLEVMTVQVLSCRRTDELRDAVKNDITCQQLSEVIVRGWPSTYKELPQLLRPFFSMKEELTLEDGLLLRGQRLVIPAALQKFYAGQLHQGHPGIEATKRRARETMYWPSMYSDIEREVSRCAACNALTAHHTKEPMQLHDIPELPWSFTAADIFEWCGKMHLVLVDSYSGWFELDYLPNMTSNTVIAKLKRHFATHGVPHTLMTDNGTQFTGRDFANFSQAWDFKHIRSSPYYPQSNGLAERAVRSAKHLLEKCHRDGTDILAAILHTRNIPRDGLPSSAQRLMSRRTRTFLPATTDMLRPTIQVNVAAAITKHRTRGKVYHDRNAHRLPALKPGQTVRVQTERGFDHVARVQGPAQQPNSYVIASQGKNYIRNRRHLLRVDEDPLASSEEDVPLTSTSPAPDGENDANTPPPPSSVTPVVVNTAGPAERQLVVTRAGRVCQPNQRYGDYVST